MARKNHKNRARRNLRLLSKLFIIAAIIVLSADVIISWNQHQTNNQSEQSAGTQASDASNDGNSTVPSVEKPSKSEFDSHTVAADAPRYLSIPKLSLRAMVKPLGLTKEGAIDSPSNVFNAGWYTGSAKPGQPGAMLIDGHVSGRKTPGLFHDLKTLKKGDMVHVERGDGSTISYRVVKSQTHEVDQVDMNAVLTPINPDKPGLNLITCAGDVIKGTNDFNKRIVVFTEQI